MVRISNLDILNILKENARISFSEIAKKFEVSDTAIRKRIRKLEKNGVIKKYTIEINPKKIGFEIDAFIGIDTKPEQYIQIIEKLKKMKEVINLYSSSGDHMILAECWFKNSSELTKFVERLNTIIGITKICPAIVLEKIK
jgi:Lrp/AsnC family transcriptional regulator for asnA, asnC and gidA